MFGQICLATISGQQYSGETLGRARCRVKAQVRPSGRPKSGSAFESFDLAATGEFAPHGSSVQLLWVLQHPREVCLISAGLRMRATALRPRLCRGAQAGAGDGNRTRDASLEGWSITTMQHPHKETLLLYWNPFPSQASPPSNCNYGRRPPEGGTPAARKTAIRGVGIPALAGLQSVHRHNYNCWSPPG